MVVRDPQRPPFARDFPADARLDALVAAFEAGDFARVREEASRLIASSDDEAVRRSARELVARTKADPLAVVMVALAAALLVALSLWWIAHDGPH